MKYIIIALALFIAVLISACSTNNISTTGNAVVSVKEVKITAYQFGFEPSVVTLKKGEPVRLTFTSKDIVHSVALFDFGKSTKEFGPGESVSIDLIPDKTGKFIYQCSTYCGGGHSDMLGTIIVTE